MHVRNFKMQSRKIRKTHYIFAMQELHIVHSEKDNKLLKDIERLLTYLVKNLKKNYQPFCLKTTLSLWREH